MAKFLDITLDILSYEAAASTNSPDDATKIKETVSETSITELSRIQRAIPTATSDQVVAVPSTEAEYLAIFSDQTISIKINGGAAITLEVHTAGTKAPVFFIRGDITALTVSNASGSTANVDFILVNV